MHPPSLVISASRRSDIPAFYMTWFMQCIERGEFAVTNPFNRRVTRVPATAPPVHTIVFWSKNFGPFLEAGWGDHLIRRGYHLFFQFTLNSEDLLLEPNLPALSQRLEQLHRLSDRFGPQAVNWRLDPICHYRWNGDGTGQREFQLRNMMQTGRSGMPSTGHALGAYTKDAPGEFVDLRFMNTVRPDAAV